LGPAVQRFVQRSSFSIHQSYLTTAVRRRGSRFVSTAAQRQKGTYEQQIAETA
jgi:hypothetical protein